MIGREATLSLARCVKHRVLYVPRTTESRYRADGERACAWIERVIGVQLTAKLVKEFGGIQLNLAKCANIERAERRERIAKSFFRDGKSIKEIALEQGLTPIWVRKYYLGLEVSSNK